MHRDNPRIWVTWERHRRSQELATALGCDLHTLTSNLPYGLRVFALSAKTTLLLSRLRPRTLFIQNPSLILATLACCLRPLLRYRLVVDRHSNFILRTLKPPRILGWVFDRLSRFTNRHADLTIVTNEVLKDLVSEWHGRGFVLQDKLPTMNQAEPWLSRGLHNFTFVGTFSADEPVDNVVAAARLLPDDYIVHITGNTALAKPGLLGDAPPNVVFTGYLPESSYQGLLAASDAVLGLTTRPHTLLCCAYEAVALHRPLVLSDHEDLLAYFHRGVIPTDNSPASLAAAMREAAERRDELVAEAGMLAEDLSRDWKVRFSGLQAEIARLESTAQDALSPA